MMPRCLRYDDAYIEKVVNVGNLQKVHEFGIVFHTNMTLYFVSLYQKHTFSLKIFLRSKGGKMCLLDRECPCAHCPALALCLSPLYSFVVHSIHCIVPKFKIADLNNTISILKVSNSHTYWNYLRWSSPTSLKTNTRTTSPVV